MQAKVWIRSWSGSCAGQPAVTIITCCCALSSWVFHLRQLRPAIRTMTTAAARTAVQAFICCRLDYCNSLLYGMSDGLFRKIQSIQNAAALSGHWDPSMWPHYAGAASIALASCSSTSWLHDCMSGAPVASGSDTCILVTSNLWRTLIAVRYVQPPSGHACMFHGHTQVSGIEVSVPQTRMCGTAWHRTYTTRHELRAFPT